MRPIRDRFSIIDRLFGLIEHPKLSDRFLLRTLFFATIGTGLFYILAINSGYVISTPSKGGSLVEGIIGIPRFVNPALALTRADQDTSALIYRGLMKIDTTGNLIPDIAEKIELSEDKTTYHIFLNQNQFFHDGTPITAKDVIFTIKLIQDPDLKSPLRGNWSDVTSEAISDYELKIILKEPYAPFIENFTVGIMPSHIWSGLPIEQLPFSQYNTEPIGSGPFMISKVNRDATGLISGYLLKPAPKQPTEANLANIELKFFQNESALINAFNQKQINATVFLPTETINQLDKSEYQIISQPLPRIFAIFINQNHSPALRDKSARRALSAAVNRQVIVDKVLGGYGVPNETPIVEEQLGVELKNSALEQEQASSSEDTPEAILLAGGWKKTAAGSWEKKINGDTQTLAVTIKTGNSPLFDKTANLVAEDWKRLGVEVQVEQYEQTGLVQSVIRSRDFQTLLFGLDMNRLQDLYPFWHSSQKDDPGLNIARYTNVTVDHLLEAARTETDRTAQEKTLNEISKIISEEEPAIFLFAPSLTYVTTKNLEIAPLGRLGSQSDRFMNISKWHAKTDNVWPIFQNNN